MTGLKTIYSTKTGTLEQVPIFHFSNQEKQSFASKKGLNERYYVLDADGDIVSTYEREIISSTVYFSQKEKYIYGRSSLGVMNDSIPLYGSQNNSYSQTTWTHAIGKRNYSLSEHRNNVLVVISDKPIPHDGGGGVVDYFLADILQTSDYTSFGVSIPERNLRKSGAKDYAMGFQGQIEDDEIKGEGNSLNYEYRMHDPRLGRFFAIDPLSGSYPWNSPYAFSENRVIDAVELEGLEKVVVHEYNRETKKFVKTKTEINYSFEKNINRYIYRDASGKITRDVYKSWDGTASFVAPSGYLDRYMLYRAFSPEAGKGSAFPVGMGIRSHWYDEGGSEAGNQDSETSGEKGWNGKGGKIFWGTIGTVCSGGTVLYGGGGWLAYTSLVMSVDDMTAQSDGSTIISKTGIISQQNLDKAKFAVGILELRSGTANYVNSAVKSPTQTITSADAFDVFMLSTSSAKSTYDGYTLLKPQATVPEMKKPRKPKVRLKKPKVAKF